MDTTQDNLTNNNKGEETRNTNHEEKHLSLLHELAENLSPEQRIELLKMAVEKAGCVRPLARATLLSKNTISRYLPGEQVVDVEAVKKILIPLVLGPKILVEIFIGSLKEMCKARHRNRQYCYQLEKYILRGGIN